MADVVVQSDLAPQWLWRLLFTDLYTSCPWHRHPRRRFCMTCLGEALCDFCTRTHPPHHPILEVHKVSGSASLRIDDVKKLMDVSNIHPFVINHHRVVRLHRELVKKPVKGHCCFNCSKTLHDSNYQFCSIACKIEAISGKESSFKRSPELPAGDQKEKRINVGTVKSDKKPMMGERRGKTKLIKVNEEPKRSTDDDDDDDQRSMTKKKKRLNGDGYCSNVNKKIKLTIVKRWDDEARKQVRAESLPPVPICRRRHRRKGIPVRAPFF
ncbi:hypothetical protein H6P81_021018 [Aristolochia fimbriata]|uniref:PLATZ transcription factor family protein n=1 Tax=Aristolochia fimbriata TaxID=158543 RepID=A0AAV7E0C6_ARIFI|nr:hypothetical protein H6P81_021018 [Aristolochia fimbriata]